MSVYRIEARRHTHPRLAGEGISDEVILRFLPEARGVLLEGGQGSVATVSLELDRRDYGAAVAEIAAALQRVGYSLVNAEVGEWVDHTIEAAVVGVVSVGGGTSMVSKSPIVRVIAAVAGGFAGAWAESKMRRLEPVYRVGQGVTQGRARLGHGGAFALQNYSRLG